MGTRCKGWERSKKIKGSADSAKVVTESGVIQFENRGRGHKPRKTAGHQKQKKARTRFSWSLQKEADLPTPGF